MNDSSKNSERIGKNHPPARFRFKPGQSGNPAGRPKGSVSIVAALRRALEENPRLADELARVFIERARKGEFRFLKELLDRIDGPATQRLAAPEDEPMTIVVCTAASPVQ